MTTRQFRLSLTEQLPRKVCPMLTPKTLNAPLSEAQIMEIETAALLPIVEDEDCPEIDPEKTRELWAEMMEALAKRSREMARPVA